MKVRVLEDFGNDSGNYREGDVIDIAFPFTPEWAYTIICGLVEVVGAKGIYEAPSNKMLGPAENKGVSHAE